MADGRGGNDSVEWIVMDVRYCGRRYGDGGIDRNLFNAVMFQALFDEILGLKGKFQPAAFDQ